MASKTYYKVKSAAGMVEEYRLDSGKLPDARNCWDSIRKGNSSMFAERPDAFLDNWKRELVYRHPGLHGEYDIYSVGADGIDDKGGKDDISNWGGVNEGYHWKKSWPLGRFTIIASCILGILIFFIRRKIPWHLGSPLAGGVISAGAAFGCFWLLHPGVIPGRNGPLSLVIAASGFLSLGFLLRTWRNFRYFNS
ncbi:MAG: type II secretion system protein GspG [Verrucomicrobiota bacterium]